MKSFLTRLVGPVLGLSLCLLPVSALAISFPFATTYNCAEQIQGMLGWVACDGLSSYGSWTTSLGSKEQITSLANYPGGAGGRGQRHWVGNGTNNDSGTVRFGFNANTDEYWLRFHIRHQSGLRLGSSSGSHKFLFMISCGNGGSCYMLMQPGTVLLNVKGTNFSDPWGWNNLYSSGAADGTWHCMEMRFRTETSSGGSNGIVEWWVDGVRRLNRTDVHYGNFGVGFNGFSMTSNGVLATVGGADMFEDIDDVAVSKTGRIGCTGATPPAAPQNLQLTP